MSGRRITSNDLAKLGVVVEDRRPRAERIVLTLKWPPSVNNLYPTIMVDGKPRRVKASAAKSYAKHVNDQLAAWALVSHQRAPGPPYRLALIAYPPANGRRHDLDNVIKLTCDSLMTAMGGGSDDNDVVSLYAKKEPPSDRPRVVVTIDGEGG